MLVWSRTSVPCRALLTPPRFTPSLLADPHSSASHPRGPDALPGRRRRPHPASLPRGILHSPAQQGELARTRPTVSYPRPLLPALAQIPQSHRSAHRMGKCTVRGAGVRIEFSRLTLDFIVARARRATFKMSSHGSSTASFTSHRPSSQGGGSGALVRLAPPSYSASRSVYRTLPVYARTFCCLPQRRGCE